jgi:hypothetical protein
MNKKILLAFGLIALLGSACGGSSKKAATPGGGTSALSCNFSTGGLCLAVIGTVSAADTTSFNTACSTNGGTAGSGCPTANRVGTCVVSVGPPQQVYSYYSPNFTATTGQADCLAPPAGTWTPG